MYIPGLIEVMKYRGIFMMYMTLNDRAVGAYQQGTKAKTECDDFNFIVFSFST